MSPNPKGAKRNHKGRRHWTYPRALAAAAYVRPVLRSLREHKLEVQHHRLRAKRLADRPGRPDRATLIAHQEALQEAHRAEQRMEEALQELRDLNIVCADVLKGEVLFPFVHDEQRAWFLFDLFDPQPLRFWRYRQDADDVRRPVQEVVGDSTGHFRLA